VLEIRDLTVSFSLAGARLKAVDEVSLTIGPGQRLGLAGESGCGKSTLASSILGLLEENARVEGGRILFQGRDLLALSPKERRELLWEEIAFVPQASLSSLNPVYRVAEQALEAVRLHRLDARKRKSEYLERLGTLSAAAGLEGRCLRSFPHQLSGGMLQRAVIAMAFVLEPRLIVGDEPTTALDVITQGRVMRLFRSMAEGMGSGLLMISHDLASLALVCDSLAIMYAGRIVESGPWARVTQEPWHPYTMGLLNSVPGLDRAGAAPRYIPGVPPRPTEPLAGCKFAPRCPFVLDPCRGEVPGLRPGPEPGRRAACHRLDEAGQMRRRAAEQETWRKKS